MSIPSPAVPYEQLVSRNLGFLSPAEQARLQGCGVFVCGVGGMGGAVLQSLVRLGIGRVALADGDSFEVSNLNRQVFAWRSTLGRNKVEATRAQLLEINPTLAIELYGPDWVDQLTPLLARYPVVVNGMDDVGSAIRLYREAARSGATVVDAYFSPLPSVAVVRPRDPRPEARLGFPTVGRSLAAIDADTVARCVQREVEYVLANSSSAEHVDLDVAAELLAGRRPRPSLAPMVIMTGTLMAFEVVKLLLGRGGVVDCRGVFYNPWTLAVERPRRGLSALAARLLARRALRRLVERGGSDARPA
jgi:molybdopterin-synthase adenylyltransferase